MSQSRARRTDQRRLIVESTQRSEPAPACRGYLGRIVDLGSMPTTAPGIVATRPLRLSPVSTPGSASILEVDADSEVVPVLLLGGAAPRAGMDVLAWPVGGTLVSVGARRCSGGTLTYAWSDATCNWPPSINVIVSKDGEPVREVVVTRTSSASGFGQYTTPAPGEYVVEYSATYFETATRTATFERCNLARSVSAAMTPIAGTPADEGVLPDLISLSLTWFRPGYGTQPTETITLTRGDGRSWSWSAADGRSVTFRQTARCSGAIDGSLLSFEYAAGSFFSWGPITVSGYSYPSIAMGGVGYPSIPGFDVIYGSMTASIAS